MRCKTCNYSLWNLTTRTCPECGEPFAPSEFRFRPNCVEFRCPHCAQPYFGVSAAGHLTPAAFDCVTCHAHIEMDEMVLVPAPGIDPERTTLDQQHWIHRSQIGRRKAWWKTSVLGLFNPVQLARSTPPDAALWPAWKFTILNLLLVIAANYAVVVVFGMLGALLAFSSGGTGAGPGAWMFVLMILGVYAGVFLAAFLLQLLFIAIWIALAHLTLKLTGGAPRPMRATSLSILYTSGANLPNMIPCVNSFSWFWWPITAGIALKGLQGVSAWRAVTATILPPVVVVGSLVGGYIALVAWLMSAANGGFATIKSSANATLHGTAVWIALNTYTSNTGSPPSHLLELVADGSLDTKYLTHPNSATLLSDIRAGDITLNEFILLPPDEQLALAQAAAEDFPDDIVAHRLGDLVYTHHGFNRTTDFNLWVLILSPDPDANPGATEIDGFIWVVLASGSVEEFGFFDFDQALADQNDLRATHDLAPLPHPSQVRHNTPARAKP